MKAAKALKASLEHYQDLPSSEKAWVRHWLAGDAVPMPRRHASALISSLVKNERSPTVFLSHSHADKSFVRALARKFGASGIDCWLDEAEIKTGESLIERLSEAVADVDFVLAILSPNSVRSRWVREELLLAMTRQIKGKRLRVLPVVKAPCKLPAFLAGRLYRDLSSAHRRRRDTPILIREILESLNDKDPRKA
jgi:TIR domain